jgi:hypothetical protein
VSPYGFALYLYERHIRKEGAIKLQTNISNDILWYITILNVSYLNNKHHVLGYAISIYVYLDVHSINDRVNDSCLIF